jgi:hypothetical protein
MDYNLITHFYLKTGKLNAKGQAPVYLRITLNGLRTEISTNQSILPVNWNKCTERVKGNSEETRILNNYLDTLILRVSKHFNTLLNNGDYFDINDLKSRLIGKDIIKRTLVRVFEENNKLMLQDVGSKYDKITVKRYFISIERLKKFIKDEYNAIDIPLDRLNYQFMIIPVKVSHCSGAK